MRRRAALRALAGLGAAALPARAAGHETPTATPTPSPTGTPPPPTARPETFGPIGRLPLAGAKEAVVADGHAFVAVTDGFAVVDLADPAAPRVVHENRAVAADREDGPMKAVYDVKVDGDLLAVVGPAHPQGPDEFEGLVVYDVADPAAPERVSVHETSFFNHNCDVRDGVVYLCGNAEPGHPLVTVDARAGEELGRWSITEREPAWADVSFGNWPLHDVWAADGYAYLAHWDAGTWVVDVSDPADPSFVAHVRGRDPATLAGMSDGEARRAAVEPPGNDHFVATTGDGSLFAVGVEAWDVDPGDDTGGPGGVHLFDNGDPADPTAVATIEPPPTSDATFDGVWTTSHNFEFRGDLLVTSWYRGGVRVHDVSDPSDPTELAAWRDSARTSFWTARHASERFFVAASRRDPSADGRNEGAALYTFPNPTYETPTPSPSPTPTPSPAAEPTGPGTGDGSGPGTPTSNPGFGALAALAALGAAGVAAWRRRGG